MKWFKKREPLGYLILFLCTGYEKIPTIKCAFGKYEKQLIEWKYDDNYWFPVIYKRTIPIYKKGIKILEKKGYNINKFNYYRHLGWDECLNYNRRKILNTIPKHE